jgi:rod shape-determining protein MreD
VRRIVLILLVILAVILQVSFLPGLRPFGVVPNLVLVVIVLVSLQVGTSESLMMAAASGLVLDLVSGTNFGLWTGVLMLTVLVVGLMRRAGIELDALVVATILVAAATVVIAGVIWLTSVTKVSNWPMSVAAGRLMGELVINLGLMMLLRLPMRWIQGSNRGYAEMGA